MFKHLKDTSTVRHPLRGIIFFVLALFLFACLDATFKVLVQRYSVPVLAFARYLVHTLLMLALLAPRMGARLIQARQPGRVLMRGMCLVLLTLFMTTGLARLPLAEATSIMFVAPLLVAILAGPLLGEATSRTRRIAVATGFLGMLLIVRPNSTLDTLGVVLVLLGACSNAAYQLMSRMLSRTEGAYPMLFYSALAGTVCFGLAAPFFLGGPPLTWLDVLLILSMGVNGGVGHLLFTLAYRDAPASLLAPITYLQLVWAGLMGWLLFGQFPDVISLLGMGVITLSGVVVALQSHRTQA